jgi:hypothetical protein
VSRPARHAAVLLALVVAGCATGLRRPAITVGIDLDADRRVDRIETIEEGRVTRVVEAPPPGSKPARTVVLAIDAVPYAVFDRLQRQGLFREFFPAARMVGPFPSLTNAGYAAILKTARGLGYEDKYYDPVRNRVGGGVFDRLKDDYKRVAPFHELFDWEPPSFWGVTIYKFPMTVSRAELHEVEETLHSSDDEELVLYFGGTDALAPSAAGRASRSACASWTRWCTASWPQGAATGGSCSSRTTGRQPSPAGGWTWRRRSRREDSV